MTLTAPAELSKFTTEELRAELLSRDNDRLGIMLKDIKHTNKMLENLQQSGETHYGHEVDLTSAPYHCNTCDTSINTNF